jgi:hypothetical protein
MSRARVCRHTDMDELQALVGQWRLVATIADGTRVSDSETSFEWIADGDFLLQHGGFEPTEESGQLWKDNAPRSFTTVIGADDRTGNYGYLYADSRGVKRVAEMSFDGREWRVWGQPGSDWYQRFLGTVSDDGNRIDGSWETSPDGESWELDFELTYTRR